MKMNLKAKTTTTMLIALFLASILGVAFNIPSASADCPVSYPVIGPSTWTYEFNYVVDPWWVPDPMPLPGGVQDGFCFDKMTGVVSASVTGSAAAAGWTVGFVSPTTVVFDAKNVVGGGPWSGFNIYAPGMVDGPVDWYCDHGAGVADDNDLLHGPNPPEVGYSLHDILREEWRFDMRWYSWGHFGASSAIADLGVNTVGGEPDSDLEIATGSDELWGPPPSAGVWRTFDSTGSLEWQTGTHTDEARSSLAIADIDGDGDLEMAGGTTSGWYVEVLDHLGNFVWTFPKILTYVGGPFVWPSSPALCDINPDVGGLELVIGNRDMGNVWAFDGDNSDGIDEGITIDTSTIPSPDFPGYWYALGAEGIDWDVLWKVDTGNEVWASPACGDVDDDGTVEVVIGSTNGKVYIIDGPTGTVEHTFTTGGAVYASAALANLDGDTYLEIVVGSNDGKIYSFQWTGAAGSTEWTYTTGGAVYSSAAIGDIDNDGALEIVVGSNDGKVYALGGGAGGYQWSFTTGGAVYSSPALAERCSVDPYDKDWPMFRNNPCRTGLYGTAPPTSLDVYVGSDDGYLYLIEGDDGTEIDRFRVNVGPYPWPQGGIHISPVVADVDGDKYLEIFFYDWGTASIHGGHTYWALEDSIIRKEMTPTSGGLGTVVHITLHVGVPWQVTVKVIDTLPKQFKYIPGSFKVDGVSATPTITLVGPPPGKHEQLSYTITELCHHVIEFDAKVVEAKKEDWEVYNTAKVEWYKEDELYHEKEIVEPFVIKAFCELNKNVGIPKKVKVIPVPWQFWIEFPGGVTDIIVFDPPEITEPVAIVRDYAVLHKTEDLPEGYIPLELLTWEGTQELPGGATWEPIDTPEDPCVLKPGEEAVYDILIDPAASAVLLRYTVAWNSSRDVIEAHFVNEAILESESPQVIVGQLSNFDVHNDYHEPVDNFELELYGVDPADIVWWFQGWGAPPQISPIAGGTEILWIDPDHPIQPCEWVHFGLHLRPSVIPEGGKAYLTQLDGGLVIKEKTEVQWRLEIEVTNPFPWTMTDVVITDRLGAELEIDEPFPYSITHGSVSYTWKGTSHKVFLTWTVGDLLPGETARLIILVSTDRNPGKGDCNGDGEVDVLDVGWISSHWSPGPPEGLLGYHPDADINDDERIDIFDLAEVNKLWLTKPTGHQEYTEPGVYELNSGATLKFIDPEQNMQLSAYTDSIYVTVLPLEDP